MAGIRKAARMMPRLATTFNEMLQKHKREYLQETGKTLATTGINQLDEP